MTRYAEHVSGRETAQTDRARADQVENNAGGFVFAVDVWARLDRFLLLGTEGGTFYVAEKPLTIENALAISQCLALDPERTVARIVQISDEGRAPKNDPAIFALAVAASDPSPKARALALQALPKVCRIGTHLFHFAQSVSHLRGWGPALQKAVARWYTERPVDKLALQAVKYQQRDGWSHRDVIRLAHPKAKTPEHNALLRWIRGAPSPGSLASKHPRKDRGTAPLPAIVEAFEAIQAEGVDKAQAIRLITDAGLPHECVPGHLKAFPEVWEAMLPSMGQTALLRNLAKMTACGLLQPMGGATQRVAEQLTDTAKLFAGRVHPITVLLALKTYASGHGLKGSLAWSPVREIADALDTAFDRSFQAIEPSGKRMMLAVDCSGSMGAPIGGTSLTCRDAAAAMAMATARTEKDWYLVGFTAGAPGLSTIPVSAKTRLDALSEAMRDFAWGSTDCALPMVKATEQKLKVDTFVVYTDNETWAESIQPFQALRRYREVMGATARLVVVGMTANEVSIADPTDRGMMDVVGFDAGAAAVIADFAAGREVTA